MDLIPEYDRLVGICFNGLRKFLPKEYSYDDLKQDIIVAVLDMTPSVDKLRNDEGYVLSTANQLRKQIRKHIRETHKDSNRQKSLDFEIMSGVTRMDITEDAKAQTALSICADKEEKQKSALARVPPEPKQFLLWAANLRSAMFNSITENDVTKMMAAVVEKAKAGDLNAVKLLINYTMGGEMKTLVHEIIRDDP